MSNSRKGKLNNERKGGGHFMSSIKERHLKIVNKIGGNSRVTAKKASWGPHQGCQ